MSTGLWIAFAVVFAALAVAYVIAEVRDRAEVRKHERYWAGRE